MKRSRFSEEQIIKILKSAESGVPVEELSRKHGFSRATFLRMAAEVWRVEIDDAKLSRMRTVGSSAWSRT